MLEENAFPRYITGTGIATAISQPSGGGSRTWLFTDAERPGQPSAFLSDLPPGFRAPLFAISCCPALRR